MITPYIAAGRGLLAAAGLVLALAFALGATHAPRVGVRAAAPAGAPGRGVGAIQAARPLTGTAAFHDSTPAAFLPVTQGTLAWGDYDGDGRLDVIVIGSTAGGQPSTRLYHNDGAGAFHDATPAGLVALFRGTAVWGDYDNDGRLDLILAGLSLTSNVSKVYHNDGNGQFADATPPGLPAGDYGSVAWGDYDGDGRLDFALSGAGGNGGLLVLYHNDGGTFHDATPAAFVGVSLGDLAWGDYDADGRLDLLVEGRHGASPQIWLYHNDGGGQFADVTPAGLPAVEIGAVAWGDADGDGRLDFVLTGQTNLGTPATRLFHNDSPAPNLPPGPPAALTATDVTTSSALLGWSAASDPEAPPAALSYNLRVGTAPGAADVLAPMANTTVLTEPNGLRQVPALGPARPGHPAPLQALQPGTTYYWSVQAVDPAWAGGPFAAEGQFTTAGAGSPSPTPTPAPAASATATQAPTGTAPPAPSATAPPPPSATPAGAPSRTPSAAPSASPPPLPSPSATAIPASPTHPPASATPAATATACAPAFTDVHESDYFYAPVGYLACHGVISGYADRTFRPYANTTRAQMVKIVVLGFGLPLATPSGGAYTFADVPPAQPFYAVIETAAAHQVVSGYACGGPGEPCDAQQRPYFRPSANVTRGQLAKIDVVAAGWALQTPPSPTFADVAPGSAFYPFVETAVCRGAVSGYADGTFRPGAAATRGQIAKIVYLSLAAPACAGPGRAAAGAP